MMKKIPPRASSAKSVNWPRLSPTVLSGCFSSKSCMLKNHCCTKAALDFLPMKKAPDRSSMTEAGGSKGKAVLTRHFS